jgi:hypothetical protein
MKISLQKTIVTKTGDVNVTMVDEGEGPEELARVLKVIEHELTVGENK